jgi:hypothetical protein
MSMRMLFIGTFVATGAALLAAPEQTALPGQMTQARVWVQNRAEAEAIPIDLRAVNVSRPIRVDVANGDPHSGLYPVNVRLADSQPVNVRLSRQAWEYTSISVDTGVDPVSALNAQGADGWETTGVFFVSQNRTTLVLKRLRQGTQGR